RVSLSTGVRLLIYSRRSHDGQTPAQIIYSYGERLRLTAKLHPPRNFRNPGAFEYRGYLAEQGITELASAHADEVEVLSGFSGNRAEAWRQRVHQRIVNKIHQLWPED